MLYLYDNTTTRYYYCDYCYFCYYVHTTTTTTATTTATTTTTTTTTAAAAATTATATVLEYIVVISYQLSFIRVSSVNKLLTRQSRKRVQATTPLDCSLLSSVLLVHSMHASNNNHLIDDLLPCLIDIPDASHVLAWGRLWVPMHGSMDQWINACFLVEGGQQKINRSTDQLINTSTHQ